MTKQGIMWPFRFGSDFNPVLGSGDDLIESRMERVLGTRRAGPRAMGELAWRHYFGSRLEFLRLQNMDDTTLALAYVYAVESLQDPMPDELVERVSIVANDNSGTVDIAVFTRSRQNKVKRGTTPIVTVKRT